jgi:small ligand-binding sensory domain FIST
VKKLRHARAAAAAGTGPDAAEAVEAALAQVRAELRGEGRDAVGQRERAGGPGSDGEAATLAIVFIGSQYADHAEHVRDAVADGLEPDVLLGVTAQGVIADNAEIETAASLSVWAATLPGAVCTPLRYPSPSGGSATWPTIPPDAKGVVALADPFGFPIGEFLAWVDQARPGLPVAGGLASGGQGFGGNRLLLDDAIYTDGAFAVALEGPVRVTPLVSQGCRPVGPSYVVTRADRNIIAELGGLPALERVQQVYDAADESDRDRMRSGLHIGLVIDEYAEEHGTGDFLVRGVLGADPTAGTLAIGDVVHVGQTVRLHVRDAVSADEDLRRLLARLPSGPVPDAALLFTCNGRGSRLFGRPDHDAALVRDALGGVPLAGFFAAGELGPVGGRSHVHGFTASLLTIAVTDD